jgi:hypothetical protein
LADKRYREIQGIHGSTVELFESISKQEMLADKMAADLERENIILKERTAVCPQLFFSSACIH